MKLPGMGAAIGDLLVRRDLSVIEVITVGETDAHGRFTRVEELTLTPEGPVADRDIGTAH